MIYVIFSGVLSRSQCFYFSLKLVVPQSGATMDVDDEEDPVPEITKAHFEEAMKFARRLVT